MTANCHVLTPADQPPVIPNSNPGLNAMFISSWQVSWSGSEASLNSRFRGRSCVATCVSDLAPAGHLPVQSAGCMCLITWILGGNQLFSRRVYQQDENKVNKYERQPLCVHVYVQIDVQRCVHDLGRRLLPVYFCSECVCSRGECLCTLTKDIYYGRIFYTLG